MFFNPRWETLNFLTWSSNMSKNVASEKVGFDQTFCSIKCRVLTIVTLKQSPVILTKYCCSNKIFNQIYLII